MLFYINLFFVYSISGFIFEEVFTNIINKPFNSSVLYGPWTTVYGIAIYLMLILYYSIKSFKFSKLKEKIIYFFSAAIVLSLLEGICGYLIQLTQHKIYWKYDKLKFNIGHYMSLEVAVIWGILACISVYFVIPRIKKILNKIPKIITYIILVMYLTDVIITIFF